MQKNLLFLIHPFIKSTRCYKYRGTKCWWYEHDGMRREPAEMVVERQGCKQGPHRGMAACGSEAEKTADGQRMTYRGQTAMTTRKGLAKL